MFTLLYTFITSQLWMLLISALICAAQEITPDAQFIVGGASRFDVQQGELG